MAVALRAPHRCGTHHDDDGLLTTLGLCSPDGRSCAALLSNLDPLARRLSLRFSGLADALPRSARVLEVIGGLDHLSERALGEPSISGGRTEIPLVVPPLSAALLLVEPRA